VFNVATLSSKQQQCDLSLFKPQNVFHLQINLTSKTVLTMMKP